MGYEVYRLFDDSGRSYIGCTKTTGRQRLTAHRCEARLRKTGMKLHAALRKGIKFQVEVLFQTEDKQAAFDAEKSFIQRFGTVEGGYNTTRGGVGFDRTSKEVREKVSRTLREIYHKKPGTRLKHSRERGGGKQIFAYSIEGKRIGTWFTQADCAEYLGISNRAVSRILSSKRKSSGGYVISYEDKPPKPLDLLCGTNKPIIVKDGKRIIGRYSSMLQASKDLKIRYAALREIMRGEREHSLSFKRLT